MFVLINENGIIISKAENKHSGKAVINLKAGLWKEKQIPKNLEGKFIKYDSQSDAIVEDTVKAQEESDKNQQKSDALAYLSTFDQQPPTIASNKIALQHLINLIT